MAITSYAQNFEDVILWRALKHVERGFYIDIGAHNPVIDSVSLAFYEHGWRGVHVEPSPLCADRLRSARPDEEVIQAAIAQQAGEITFFEIPNTGMSTGDEGIARMHENEGYAARPMSISTMPLSTILDMHTNRDIHWMKIDVEGMEGQVIESWLPSAVRPWVVVVESTKPNSSEQIHGTWEPRLLALGYDFVYFDGLNRFYVAVAHPELKPSFEVGPNCFDDFSASVTSWVSRNASAETAALRRQLAEERIAKATLEAHLANEQSAKAALTVRLAEEQGARAALEAQLGAIYASTSWRITKPLRLVSHAAGWLARGVWAWLTFKPGSRPRRAARRSAIHLARAVRLARPPRLSVCISTYNRAAWLEVSLRNWARLYPEPIPGVEMLVCDNASTDHTADVVRPYLDRPDFSYRRNPVNVGMLGNLRETAHAGQGDYIWILGDDDLMTPGAIERILAAIERHPDVALAYLNYAYTSVEDARSVADLDAYFSQAIQIIPAESDIYGKIRDFSGRSENYFTAIYALVFRRDHGLNAYSQDTSGYPFSTMQNSIPTSYYVLHHMMDEPGVWIGSLQVIVNFNVSWMKYVPLFILERMPEVYEVAERAGASISEVDRSRRQTLPNIVLQFRAIYQPDQLEQSQFFHPARLVRRFKHLPEFREACRDKLIVIYQEAHSRGHPAATEPAALVFPEFVEADGPPPAVEHSRALRS